MSDTVQNLLIAGGIFVLVVGTALGRRVLSTGRMLLPLVLVGVFAVIYLPQMPMHTTGEVLFYLAAAALGALFGTGAALATKVDRDAATGRIVTISGVAFAAVWALATGLRVAFIIGVEPSTWMMQQVVALSTWAHLEQSAWAPFFVIWALTMVLVRLGLIVLRARGRRPSRLTIPSAPLVTDGR